MTPNSFYQETLTAMDPKKATKKLTVPNERAFHPLFPVPMGAAPADVAGRDISWLYIWRDGEMFRGCPLPREDFTDERSLFERWGGGVYEIKAKDQDMQGWTANTRVSLKGPRLPFNDDPVSHVAAAPVAAPAPSGGDSMVSTLTTLLAAATPLLTAFLERQDRRDEQRRRDEDKREEERRRADEARAERDREWMKLQLQQQQQQTQLILGVVTNQNGTAQTIAALEKGLQIGREVGSADAGDDDDALASIAQVVGGWNQAKAAQQPS